MKMMHDTVDAPAMDCSEDTNTLAPRIIRVANWRLRRLIRQAEQDQELARIVAEAIACSESEQ